jgi:predicted dehydrogenase
VDAIINALPNHLHAPTTIEALNAGIPVLCEKPLATSSRDARTCCDAADEQGVILCVGMNRRFHPQQMLLKLAIEAGTLGTVQSYDSQYGGPYDWDTASGFYFSRAQAGGGVLIDYGVHMLDSLVDWFGPVTGFDYQDDDWGSGIESNVLLSLTHGGRFGVVTGHARMSRTYTLPNRLLVRATQCVAEAPFTDPKIVILHQELLGKKIDTTLRLNSGDRHTAFYEQLDNFVLSIQGRATPLVDGRHALAVLELIENCYAQRKRIPEPWSEVVEFCGVEV